MNYANIDIYQKVRESFVYYDHLLKCVKYEITLCVIYKKLRKYLCIEWYAIDCSENRCYNLWTNICPSIMVIPQSSEYRSLILDAGF